PIGVATWSVEINYALDSVLARQPAAIMMLRGQAERMWGDLFPSAGVCTRGWGRPTDRYKRIAGTGSRMVYPWPMNRGLEISAAAADSAQNTALEQVANGVSVRMAVLYLLLAGQPGQ